MTTPTIIDYALMAGASYISNRPEVNRIPTPQNWLGIKHDAQPSGFEAISFIDGATIATSTTIVISYAGTDFSSPGSDFVYGNIPLATGNLSDQLRQAADYYLQVKALNPTANITFTGHSLGGGLASLMAVLFDETAYTFDQAPFRGAADGHLVTDQATGFQITASAASNLRAYLTGTVPDTMLTKLDAYITALDIFNTNKIAADTLAVRETKVFNLNVQGEILSNLPVSVFDRIGTQADANNLANSMAGISGGDLHSQALLTAMLQSGDTSTSTVADHTLGQATLKLPDLLKMIFDKKLFYHDPLNLDANAPENFLERLVKHQAGVQPDAATGSAAIPADAMVTRFTADLWKLAQDGGLTTKDWTQLNGSDVPRNVSRALIAFAMQKYYEETQTSTGYKKELFADLSTEGGSNGIRFAITDVSSRLESEYANREKGMELNRQVDGKFTLKGYQYFQQYLQQVAPDLGAGAKQFTVAEQKLIKSMLPQLRDWYVQAGASGMTAIDTLNSGAFMLGGNAQDTLTGGTKADLLVGNAGDDILKGGDGSDVLIGGTGVDTYAWNASANAGIDTILDSDKQGYLRDDSPSTGSGQAGAIVLTGGTQYGDNRVFSGKDANGTNHIYTYPSTSSGRANGDAANDSAWRVTA